MPVSRTLLHAGGYEQDPLLHALTALSGSRGVGAVVGREAPLRCPSDVPGSDVPTRCGCRLSFALGSASGRTMLRQL
eukprot:643013-Alexandrium_andersonii.AAC.1